MKKIGKSLLVGTLLSSFLLSSPTNACTRFTYSGLDKTVITARSLDWMEDIQTDLWALPAGIEKTGNTDANNIKWTSKYGSVIASGYNIGTADGINTRGLSANLLYLSSSEYGASTEKQKNLSLYLWAQYVLDNFATVQEAVNELSKEEFNIVSSPLPNGSPAHLHLAITDTSGDNAIFEYINGKLVIHHGKEYNVMTNDPPYNSQLALYNYWSNLKGAFLPGGYNPEDRFVRAKHYLETVPPTSGRKAVATALSIMRSLSVPIGITTKDKPNVATTYWRSVADLKQKIYYFDSAYQPNTFWVDINKLNLEKGGKTKKLSLADNIVYSGEVSASFVESRVFTSPVLKSIPTS